MELIDTGKGGAIENMRFDSELLGRVLDFENTLLHFYDWSKKSMTYGYFVNPKEHLHIDLVKAMGFTMARRTSGGGILFHGKDLTFSFLVPKTHPLFSTDTLENYRHVNQGVVSALKDLLPEQEFSLVENDQEVAPECHRFCRAKPVRYDVLLRGKKVAGAAQRRTLNGFLHQGSISLGFEDPEVEGLFLSKEVWKNMQNFSTSLLGCQATEREISTLREDLKKALVKSLKKIWINC